MSGNGHPSWWLRFWLGVAVAGAAMIGISITVLSMERNAVHAREDANRQGMLRLALWRMDSWLAPRLGREAARPYYEYLSFYPNRDVYTKYYGRIEPGDVMSPSPLLTFASEYFPLHFQVDANGVFSSPQVPDANAFDLASYQLGLTPETVIDRGQQLAAIEATLEPVNLSVACVTGVARANQSMIEPDAIRAMESQLAGKNTRFEDDDVQTVFNWQDRTRRGEASNEVQQDALKQQRAQQIGHPLTESQQQSIEAAPTVDIGPLVPVWVKDDTDTRQNHLFYIRRVQVGEVESFQGVAVDWPALRSGMIGQTSDLIEDIDLQPQLTADEDAAQSVWMLATIPAVLRSSATLPYTQPMLTPARITLGLAWLGLLAACVAVGMTLRSTIDYGERRNRFVSAVTHELRTPLTTFRMYTEMLVDGMVEDPQQRVHYHRTLRDESVRLSGLIENMLSYARVEQGKMLHQIDLLTPDDLIEKMRPCLRNRTQADGIELNLAAFGTETSCRVDADSIEQIVLNLVDNACKYACDGDDMAVHVELKCQPPDLVIRVSDHGPGVPPALRERIFEPFDRGAVPPGSHTPGVGIGLALSRGLAQSMGGSLEVDATGGSSSQAGLCVVLRVPMQMSS